MIPRNQGRHGGMLSARFAKGLAPIGRTDGPRALGGFGLLVIVVALIGAMVSSSGSFENVLLVTCLWGAAAIGWNISGGLGGELSLGHALFFATGAYGTVLLQLHFGITPWFGVLVSAAGTAVVAVAFGALTLRLRGPYFALGTLAVAQAGYQIAVWNISVLGGQDGLTYPLKTGAGIMSWEATQRPYFWIAIGLLTIALFVAWLVSRHRIGFMLRAVRDDEIAAASTGVRTIRVRVAGLVIGAVLTALAGGILGRFEGTVTPSQFLVPTVSLQLLVICYIGGIGTLSGPVWGTALVVGVQNYLFLKTGSDTTSTLFAAGVGCAFVLSMIVFPGGIARVVRSGRKLLASRFGTVAHQVDTNGGRTQCELRVPAMTPVTEVPEVQDLGV